MYSRELLKGTLTTIILRLLKENDRMYGYQITQCVKEMSEDKILIKEGSLYPALHKLKDDGLVKTESVKTGNRVRKYYSLTQQGNAESKKKVEELFDFMKTLKILLTAKPSLS